MRAAALLIVLVALGAPLALAGDELSPETQKALDAVVKDGSTDAATVKTLVAAKERKAVFAALLRAGGDAAHAALEALTGEKGPKTIGQWSALYAKEFQEELDGPALAREKTAAEALLATLPNVDGKPQDSVALRTAIRNMRTLVAKDAETTADALLARLREKLGMKSDKPEIAAMKKRLVVTCIVVDPRPSSKNSAIVHWDGAALIYDEGDRIRDKDHDLVLGQLKIKKIAEGVVTFTLGAEEFLVELKSPS
jgi:hypothetical protein